MAPPNSLKNPTDSVILIVGTQMPNKSDHPRDFLPMTRVTFSEMTRVTFLTCVYLRKKKPKKMTRVTFSEVTRVTL